MNVVLRSILLGVVLTLAGGMPQRSQSSCTTINECSEAIDALRRETRLELDQREIAINIATTNLEKRLEGMNEFRAQLKDQAGTFVTREKFDADLEAVKKRLDAADRSRATMLGGFAVLQFLFGVGLVLYLKKSPIRSAWRSTDDRSEAQK